MTSITLTFFRADRPDELTLVVDDQVPLEQVLTLVSQQGFLAPDHQHLDVYLLTHQERQRLSKESILQAAGVQDEDMLLIQSSIVPQETGLQPVARLDVPFESYPFPYASLLEGQPKIESWTYTFAESRGQSRKQPAVAILQRLLEEIFANACEKDYNVFGILLAGVFTNPATQEPWVEILDIFPVITCYPIDSSEEVVLEEIQRLQAEAEAIAWRSQGVIRLVGWYHVHLDQSIFLSPADRAIQAQMYPEAWQIALVVDPVRKHYGLFTGPEGTPLLEGFFVIPDEEVLYFGTPSHQSWKRAMLRNNVCSPDLEK